ncbi:MAG: phenylalanine--tRNA ligase subunit beta [Halioglobus sp.]|nr:phenylalanine--tRNA ligase subunit beta [Halioglobus sp.]
MKISEKWLREWVDPCVDTRTLAHQMTMAGLEIEAIEPVAGEFSGVIVGEILSIEPHPDADKLRVCQVNAGAERLQIVCGAPNARVGLKAPLAIVGGELPGGLKIRKAKLRGVESQGMLCGGLELGLSEDNVGLMELADDAPVGEDLVEYLGLDDCVLEIGLTPNRADCLGIRGIAREVGLLNNCPVHEVSSEPVQPSLDEILPVELRAPERCAHFVGRIIRGVDLSRPSPLWMQERLRRCGLRSIDAVVDVTNYVMLELGQPMHAFDRDKLTGGIIVRTADAGETLTLLDGSEVTLTPDSLVIADHSGAMALAGIMGGDHSAVRDNTQNLFLESAFFTPELIAGKARAYGMHTDASHRFERGVDFALQVRAMERATQLLLEVVGGEAGPIIEEIASNAMPVRGDVTLRSARIRKLLGLDLSASEVERILSGLGLGVTAFDGGWTCTVPSWRFDINIEVDLLEELARIYGYNQLPASRVRADLVMPVRPESRLSARALRRHLAARGYQEAITYSFIDPKLQALFDPDHAPVALTNPISSDMAVMRTRLLPGLLAAVAHNTNRQQSRVRLFETGLRFVQGADALHQVPTLALVCSGERFNKSWSAVEEASDFFDLKGDVESVLSLTRRGQDIAFDTATLPGLHPGQTATITRKGQGVGYIGALHPAIGRDLGLESPVYACELDLETALTRALPRFEELSKFPEVKRDLSFVVDQTVTVAQIMADVSAAAGPYLTDLRLFDVYTGKGIDPKRKSLSLGLTFRDQSRTLGDEDINLTVGQVIDLLEKNYNAELRK